MKRTLISAFLVATFAGGFAVSQAAQSVSASSTPSGSAGTSAPADASNQPESLTPYTGDLSELKAGAVAIKDCPEPAKFVMRDEVRQFYLEHFGRADELTDRYIGGCPDVEEWKRSYEAARAKAAAR